MIALLQCLCVVWSLAGVVLFACAIGYVPEVEGHESDRVWAQVILLGLFAVSMVCLVLSLRWAF